MSWSKMQKRGAGAVVSSAAVWTSSCREGTPPIGFFLYMPDSLVSATAAIDFGTRQGAATASGMINGFGSVGAIIGGVLPGVLAKSLGTDVDIWVYVFPSLAVSLIIAALLLLPRWNAMPDTADNGTTEATVPSESTSEDKHAYPS